MQRSALIRFGLAGLVVLGGGAATFMAGCGDDSSGTTTGDDGGTGDDGSTPVDSGNPGDGGSGDDGGDAATPPHAKAIVVHASADTNIGAVRVCFGLKKTGTSAFVVPPLLALPDTALPGQPYAGLFPGTGGPLPDLLDLVDYDIKPYIIPAALIAADAKGVDGGTPRTCQDLVSGDAGLPSNEYVPLPVIPAGTFAHSSTLVLAVTGCAPNAKVGDQPYCGTDYNDTNGNLAAHVYSVNRTTGAALGAQFAHLSSGAQAIGPVYPLITNNFGDGGSETHVVTPGTPVAFGGFGPDAGATQVTGVDPTTSTFGIALPDALDGGQPGTVLGAAPLLLVQAATIGTTTPADYFKNGQNYTFVVVGNPGVSTDGGGGTFNGYGIHFLGFNNDPVLP